jgi:hypothetical protein
MVFLVQSTWVDTVPVGYCETQGTATEKAREAVLQLLADVREQYPSAKVVETGHPGMPVFYVRVGARRIANVAVLVVKKLD